MSIKYLRNSRGLSLITVIAMMALMLTAILPAVTAQLISTDPRKTTAYISVSPKVIGKGQQMTVNCWVWPAPSGPSFYAQNLEVIYYENFTVSFTRPDGTKDTFMPINPSFEQTLGHGNAVPGKTEAVGTTYFYYKPEQVGTWHVSFSYPGKTFFTPFGTPGVFYEDATSQTITFEVQEDPVNAGIVNGWPWSPLPTGYWQRPISANNREWSEISGNWLQYGYDMDIGTRFNPYSTGPESAHIVWKEARAIGGIIGGDWGSLSYDAGHTTWEVTVMAGRIFYNDLAGGTFSCRDLYTGELLYRVPGNIKLGQQLRPESVSADTPQTNEARVTDHLWGFTGTTWVRYDPFSGAVLQTIRNAPTADIRDYRFIDGSSEVYISQAGGWKTTRRLGNAYANLIKWDVYKVTCTEWKTGGV